MSPLPGAANVKRSRLIGPLVRCAVILVMVSLGTAPTAAAGSPLPAQIHTVAGGGTCSGAVISLGPCDGIAATSAGIDGARSVAALPGGGFLYIDSGNDLVREVSPTGIVTTVAGTSTIVGDGATVPSTTDVDGVPATESGLDDPVAVAALPNGGFLITEYAGARVRMVSPGPPGQATITTIAGIPPTAEDPAPTPGDNGTSGPGTSVELNYPSDAVPTANGGVLIADTYNDRVMLLASASPGATIQQIAGGGSCNDATSSCQGLQASQVQLDLPDSVSEFPTSLGSAYMVSELGADAVREISQESPSGVFSTIAGEPGLPGYSGDGGSATAAQLDQPDGILALGAGGFLIADTGNNVVREVSPAGVISTIAGDGTLGYTGDGGSATAAELNGPAAVALGFQNGLPNGILIADENNSAIREISQPSVSTIVVAPLSPDGAHGWYTTAPLVSVSATEGATISCVLDPPQAPPAFAAIAPGCPYPAAGALVRQNGTHTLYAASENSFGDQENPVSRTFKVDATPPKITCEKEPVLRYGKRTARVTAVLSDSVSGPRRRELAVRIDTRQLHQLGVHYAKLRGRNYAGGSATRKCPYLIRALKLTSQPAADSALRRAREKARAFVKEMLVTAIPDGTAVAVDCAGGACPFMAWRDVKTSSSLTGPTNVGVANLTQLFRGKALPYGTRIRVAITAPGTIGRYLLFNIGSGQRAAVSAGCLPPGVRTPSNAPCSPKLP